LDATTHWTALLAVEWVLQNGPPEDRTMTSRSSSKRRCWWALASAALLASGCGSPGVDRPTGNDYILHPGSTTAPPPPTVEALPSPYSYASVPIRGSAPGAVRVFITINAAGNAIAADVSQLDHTFCAQVAFSEPAFYDISVTAMADDSSVSPQATSISLQYSPSAQTPERVTLCHGETAK
jgi:hypothetical protein